MLWLTRWSPHQSGLRRFYAVSFMVGVAGALQAPTLSLFLTREVARSARFGSGCFIPSMP